MNKIFIFLVILVFTGSCRYESPDKNKPETVSFEDNLKEIYYRFPSPDEMFRFIDSSGLKFNPDVLPGIEGIDNYLSTLEQSLILGIYSADLAYITLFGKYKYSMDYLQSVYIISEKLKISGAFNQQFPERLEKNLQNHDSLKVICEEAFESLTDYLSENEQENIFAMVSMAAFVEFIHLSVSVTGDFENNTAIFQKIIADQKYVYENILKFMKEFPDDGNVLKTLSMVDQLTAFYNDLSAENEKTNVKKEDNKLVFGAKKKVNITKSDYERIKIVISDIRNKMITSEL